MLPITDKHSCNRCQSIEKIVFQTNEWRYFSETETDKSYCHQTIYSASALYEHKPQLSCKKYI